MKEPPKEKTKRREWSFIETSRDVLRNSKDSGDASSSSEKDPNSTGDTQTPDNLSEAEPDVKEYLSSSPRLK